MPTITIRLKPDQKAALEAAARSAGQSLSDYAREALDLHENRDSLADVPGRIDALEREVSCLRQLANLD